MHRNHALGIALAAAAVVAVSWLIVNPEPTLPPPSDTTATPADPPLVRHSTRPLDTDQPPTTTPASLPGDRAYTRLEHKRDQLENRLSQMVRDGQISGFEAQALHQISMATFDEARTLVDRRQSGEIHWLGAIARSVPLRLQHASRVVDAVGYDRAQDAAERALNTQTTNALDPATR